MTDDGADARTWMFDGAEAAVAQLCELYDEATADLVAG